MSRRFQNRKAPDQNKFKSSELKKSNNIINFIKQEIRKMEIYEPMLYKMHSEQQK